MLNGRDHFLPFIAMARVGGRSLKRTVAITAVCGLGHVLSSIISRILGVVGLDVSLPTSFPHCETLLGREPRGVTHVR
jgi:hypothetical protein